MKKHLRSLPEYNLGRMHYATGISDFYRRSIHGDARLAYMLGRSDAASGSTRRQIHRQRLFGNRIAWAISAVREWRRIRRKP